MNFAYVAFVCVEGEKDLWVWGCAGALPLDPSFVFFCIIQKDGEPMRPAVKPLNSYSVVAELQRLNTRRGPGEHHKQGALILGSMRLCFACSACSVVGWIRLTTWESVSVPSRFYAVETDSLSSSLAHGGIREMARMTNQHRSLYWEIYFWQQHFQPPFHALSCEDLRSEVKAVARGLLPFLPCRHGSFMPDWNKVQ